MDGSVGGGPGGQRSAAAGPGPQMTRRRFRCQRRPRYAASVAAVKWMVLTVNAAKWDDVTADEFLNGPEWVSRHEESVFV